MNILDHEQAVGDVVRAGVAAGIAWIGTHLNECRPAVERLQRQCAGTGSTPNEVLTEILEREVSQTILGALVGQLVSSHEALVNLARESGWRAAARLLATPN